MPPAATDATASNLPPPAGARVLRGLGQGGMGSVWLIERAMHDGITQRAVLKRPRVEDSDASATASYAARFRNEARALARVSHGNVVRLLDAGADAHGPWIIIEHVDGLDVHALVERLRARSERVSAEEVAWIGHEAARGMAAAHALVDSTGEPTPILHRDLSPQNLLLSRAGEVKVADFGIAWAVDRESRTTTGVVVGNLRYIAPEQLEGRSVSPATDVYGIGRVLEELLDHTEDSTCLQALRAVAQRATRRVSDERYDSMDALSDALLEAVPSLCRGRATLATRVRDATQQRDQVHLALGALLAAERADNDPAGAPPPALGAPPTTRAMKPTPELTRPSETSASSAVDTPIDASSRRSFAWSIAGGIALLLVGFTSLRGARTTTSPAPSVAALGRPPSVSSVIATPAPAPSSPPAPPIARAPEALSHAAPIAPREEPRRVVARHERALATTPDASTVAAPPAATATLRVSSIPFARVSIDGSAAVGTPRAFSLSAGSHRVHARFEIDGGVLTLDREVELHAGEVYTLGLRGIDAQ